ncbi:MAG: bifunctional methylenetetrahydrofolate dehydrogenase/methenyltetrahydrofolate cyclohydrolase FolD [Alphaproteobacteria bacterium]|nr:bifunctional methylenetetrahydrofolate dehydrogenase/methenyltetrahydrofolate cyclohydrolase FolD [Alphaproteobacteria bacterium]
MINPGRPVAIIDGKSIAAKMRTRLAARVAEMTTKLGLRPCLAVFLVGDDPASTTYVRNKTKAAEAAGIRTIDVSSSALIVEADLVAHIRAANLDPTIHGILVQLPLPKHIDSKTIIEAIDPAKDVDGLHPLNVGRLAAGRRTFVPCTPQGCMVLLQNTGQTLHGARALVIGRSTLVGRPIAQLLLNQNCTVTIAHSKTQNLPTEIQRADIVIAAIGRPQFVRGNWLKPGATVIDVGINRVAGADGKDRIVGDVAFDEARAVAGAITPVPGGVGPMTIACLLENTFTAALQQTNIRSFY